MHSTYNIKRWDSIMVDGGLNSYPALYIVPDKPLMQYIREHDFIVPIKIVGTQTGYDNQLSYARVQASQDTSGYRPNFQALTNSIVILPDIAWQGYPTHLGQVKMLITEEEKTEWINKSMKESYHSEPDGFVVMKNSSIFFPCCILIWLIFLLVCLCMIRNHQNTKKPIYVE